MSREGLPTAGDDELAASDYRRPLWQQILGAAIRSRYMPTSTEGAAPVRARPPIGGCLMRVVVLIMLLFLALVVALFVFGRSLLQGSGAY